jgi:hypothetical protein
VNELRESGREIARRSPRSRAILALRVLALGCFVAGLVADHASLRWLLIAVATGLLLVPIAWRPKAPATAGAFWSASADVMHGVSRFPGQLCFTDDSAIWTPSSYSRHHGQEQISIPLTGDTPISLEHGSSLLDVLILVRPPTGEPARFLTHWSPRLRRAIRKMRSA